MIAVDNFNDTFVNSFLAAGHFTQVASDADFEIIMNIIGEEVQPYFRQKTFLLSLVGGAGCGKTTLYNPKNGAGVPVNSRKLSVYRGYSNTYLSRKITGPVNMLIIEGDMQPLQYVDYTIYLHLSDQARLVNRIQRDVSGRNYTNTNTIIESFLLRQQYQHRLITLPSVEKANLLLWTRYDDPGSQLDYCYDVYLRSIS